MFCVLHQGAIKSSLWRGIFLWKILFNLIELEIKDTTDTDRSASILDLHLEIDSEEGSYWLSWSHHFDSFTVATMTWLAVTEYLCYKWPRICSTCRKHFPVLSHSWLIIGFVTRLTRRVQLVEQELILDRNHLSSPLVFSGVRVTRSLVFCVMYCRSFCPFLFWPLCCLSFFD